MIERSRCRETSSRARGVLALAALVAVACDAAAPAEFQVTLGEAPLDLEATREGIERTLVSRATHMELGSVSLEWTSDTTATIGFARVRDLEFVARVLERQGVVEWRIVDPDDAFRDALPAIDRALIDAGVTARARGGVGPLPGVEQLLNLVPEAEDSMQARSDGAGPLSALLFPGQIAGEFLVFEEDVPWVDSLLMLPAVRAAMPSGRELLWSFEPVSQATTTYRPLYSVERQAIVTRDDVQDARPVIDQETDQAMVAFELTGAGGRRFRQATSEHVNDYVAIVLDGQVFRQPPAIRGEIGRHGQIELGIGALQEAQDLALVMRAGALPVPLTVIAAEWVRR